MGLGNVVIILFLMCGAKTASSSLDSTDDPSGWGSFYVTNSQPLVDVTDPSGWKYDRETKTSMRKEDEDKKERIINVCESILKKRDVDANGVKVKAENAVEVEEENAVELVVEVENAVKFSVQVQHKENMNDNIVFVKRFINILLHAADLSEKESGDVSRVIEIKVSREHLETLQHFTNSGINVSLRELDYILSTSIHRKHIPTYDVPATIEKVFFMVSQKEVWLPFFLVCILLGVLRILVNSKTPKLFAMSILILIFCCSYLLEYYKKYKEVEIRQKRILDNHPEVPSSCNPANHHWLASFFNHWTSSSRFKTTDECEQYQKALLLDPFIEVSPIRVLSSILTDFIVEPFDKLATAITTFSSTIMGDLPFYYGWIVLAVSSFAIFVLLILVIVMCCNASVRVGGLFGGISISKTEKKPVANASPTEQIASDSTRDSQSIWEGMAGMAGIKNPIVLDANSLGTLLMRAQSSAALHHSGVEELLQPEDRSTQSRSFHEKLRSSNDEVKSLNETKEENIVSPVSDETSHTRHKLEITGLEKNISCMKTHEIGNVTETQNIHENVCQEGKTFVKTDNADNANVNDDVKSVDNVEISK